MPDVTDVFLQYGAVGAILLVVGTVLIKQFQAQADRLAEQCQRESNRADRLEGELRDLHAKMSAEVIPLLTQLAVLLERRERRHDVDGR